MMKHLKAVLNQLGPGSYKYYHHGNLKKDHMIMLVLISSKGNLLYLIPLKDKYWKGTLAINANNVIKAK